MPDVFGSPERKGSGGRIPDKARERYRIFPKINVSIDPDTFDRMEKYCADEERARSWVIQKALADWLTGKGY